METLSLKNEPLTLETILTSIIYLPHDQENQPTGNLEQAISAAAYRIKTDENDHQPTIDDPGQLTELKQNIALFGLVAHKVDPEHFYSFYHAVENLEVRQYRVLLDHLCRVFWQDLIFAPYGQ